MDRLICGDVGYGKTEVALRAAFKAVEDGKQVMFLVPDDGARPAALRHLHRAHARLPGADRGGLALPLRRRRCARRSTGFAAGQVDMMIGTHRLLSRDVRPKDLGLLIVDEEQRFGVKQKELLRQLRLRVDVLSLSATPIPRTLQMSLAGLRDISVIETPPEGRRPVKTYVGDYDEELVTRAIERELERKGQAFFLHNRVDTIDETAERVRAMVPKARVLVAHGQMAEGELEQVMLELPARRGRRARLHHDRGVGPRHPEREHADRGARRRARPGPALPDPRARRAGRASAPTPTCSTPPRPRSPRRRRSGSPRSPTTRSSAPASRSRCATSRSAAPATCSARTSRGTWPRWASSSTWGCSTRPCGC